MSESESTAVVVMGPREVDAAARVAAATKRQAALDGARGAGVREGLERSKQLLAHAEERHAAVLEAVARAHREEIKHLKSEWREHETEVRGAAFWRGALTLGVTMSIIVGVLSWFFAQQVLRSAFEEASRMQARTAAIEQLQRSTAGSQVSPDTGTARPDREPRSAPR